MLCVSHLGQGNGGDRRWLGQLKASTLYKSIALYTITTTKNSSALPKGTEKTTGGVNSKEYAVH
jgi:hypothetical protein